MRCIPWAAATIGMLLWACTAHEAYPRGFVVFRGGNNNMRNGGNLSHTGGGRRTVGGRYGGVGYGGVGYGGVGYGGVGYGGVGYGGVGYGGVGYGGVGYGGVGYGGVGYRGAGFGGWGYGGRRGVSLNGRNYSNYRGHSLYTRHFDMANHMSNYNQPSYGSRAGHGNVGYPMKRSENTGFDHRLNLDTDLGSYGPSFAGSRAENLQADDHLNRSEHFDPNKAGYTLDLGTRTVNMAGAGYHPSYADHGFYHGSWHEHYGDGQSGGYWRRPYYWGLGAWGLGYLLYDSGYLGYNNPYVMNGGDTTGVYNYSQPIPVDLQPRETVSAKKEDHAAAEQQLAPALDAFKNGKYETALKLVDQALQEHPTDAVCHEFRALVLFALKDYQQAAATIHSVLAVGPGWDWTTLTSLYADIKVYYEQYQALEAYAGKNPKDQAAKFLLAYHYLTCGHVEAAAGVLKLVVQSNPKDRIAADLLEMIAPPPAVESFKKGDYDTALKLINEAIEQTPADAVCHEFQALILFAQHDYAQAGKAIHGVLEIGPGWDWTTLSSLYPDINVYNEQYEALETFVKKHPKDNEAQFLLAYHYLTCGHIEAAAGLLQKLVQSTPADKVAADLLAMLDPSAAAAEEKAPDAEEPEATEKGDSITLAGTWHAERDDGSKFQLELTADSKFTWSFQRQDRHQEFSGTWSDEENLLILERKDGGALIAELTPDGEKRFNFRTLGAPGDDLGLDFSR